MYPPNGLLWWFSSKEPACKCRRHKRREFHPGVGKIPCRRKWQPTRVFLPGKSQGQKNLKSYSPWTRKRAGHDLATKQQHRQCSGFFIVQLSHPYMTTGKTIALTRQTFVGKVMSLLFNMLSSLVITFLPRSKHLLISWLQSPSAVILEPPK